MQHPAWRSGLARKAVLKETRSASPSRSAAAARSKEKRAIEGVYCSVQPAFGAQPFADAPDFVFALGQCRRAGVYRVVTGDQLVGVFDGRAEYQRVAQGDVGRAGYRAAAASADHCGFAGGQGGAGAGALPARQSRHACAVPQPPAPVAGGVGLLLRWCWKNSVSGALRFHRRSSWRQTARLAGRAAR